MMSQDDINSLMAGIDDDETSEDTSTEQDIDTTSTVEDTSSASDNISLDDDDDFDLDSLVNEFSSPAGNIDDELEKSEDDFDIDNLDLDNLDVDNINIDDIDNIELDSESSTSALDSLDAIDDDDFDVNNLDIEALAGSISAESQEEEKETDNNVTEDEILDDIDSTSSDTIDEHQMTNEEFTTQKIDEGVFPLPVEKDTKVVNQLNQVAKDGEEKATQIFDVLSFILDENNDLQTNAKDIEELASSQAQTLEILTQKFPKIQQFKSALDQSSQIISKSQKIREKIDAENMQLFEAMNLMQFQDINRQKIERVMSVIKKLSNYLNNLFEDEDGATDNLAIAKQIHGDESQSVDSDDLESLISEYSAEDL